jgi:hypothetical protein
MDAEFKIELTSEIEDVNISPLLFGKTFVLVCEMLGT